MRPIGHGAGLRDHHSWAGSGWASQGVVAGPGQELVCGVRHRNSELMCLLDAQYQVSFGTQVSGRDLSADIASRGTIAALDALDADP